MDHLNDYERGEYDAYAGYKAKDGQSNEYYFGYGDEYTKQQNETARTNAELDYLFKKYAHIIEGDYV